MPKCYGKCKEERPIEMFSSNKSKRRGLASECKICHKDMNRRARLWRKYGMTESAFNDLLALQNNCCALCKTKNPAGGYDQWHIDHDHKTGRVRGLLCNKCNLYLGSYETLVRDFGLGWISTYLNHSISEVLS